MNKIMPQFSKMSYGEKQVFRILSRCHGIENAVDQNELALLANMGPRAVRKNVETLIINHKMVICSSYDKRHGGYFLPRTGDEVRRTCQKLHGHALRILVRESTLKNISMAELLEEYQMELQFDER